MAEIFDGDLDDYLNEEDGESEDYYDKADRLYDEWRDGLAEETV